MRLYQVDGNKYPENLSFFITEMFTLLHKYLINEKKSFSGYSFHLSLLFNSIFFIIKHAVQIISYGINILLDITHFRLTFL